MKKLFGSELEKTHKSQLNRFSDSLACFEQDQHQFWQPISVELKHEQTEKIMLKKIQNQERKGEKILGEHLSLLLKM